MAAQQQEDERTTGADEQTMLQWRVPPRPRQEHMRKNAWVDMGWGRLLLGQTFESNRAIADAADGLLPHADRERRLSIMRQPDVGSFGVMALATVTLVRVGSLQAVEPNPALLAGLWCGSRTAMAAIARALPYARSSGLAAPFVGGSAALVVILGVLIAVPLVAVAHGIAGVAALAAVAAMTAAAATTATRFTTLIIKR